MSNFTILGVSPHFLCSVLTYRPAKDTHSLIMENYPVSLLADLLTDDLIDTILDSQLPEQLRERYKDMLPEGVGASKAELREVLRSEFYRRASLELSMNINENNIGSILANSFGYEYAGEGLDAFLKGIRDLLKRKD